MQAETNLRRRRRMCSRRKIRSRRRRPNSKAAIARTHQANAAKSTVAATQADLKNAEEQKIRPPCAGIHQCLCSGERNGVGARGTRGRSGKYRAPIVTIVDLSDTWARAAIPETYADHIGYGDVLRVRMPGGT